MADYEDDDDVMWNNSGEDGMADGVTKTITALFISLQLLGSIPDKTPFRT